MAAATTGGNLPPDEFPPLHSNKHTVIKPPENNIPYANLVKPVNINPLIATIPHKPVTMLHGEPNITWKSSEVRALIIKENLQYAIIEKFSCGKSNIKELRRTVPGQCGIKSECTVGVLDTRHILIRLSSLEDYVHLLSIPAFYVNVKERSWQMRTLKWDPWFEPDMETSIGVAWISFPDLPPNFFTKEAIFSIAAAIGKPLTVDMATKNQTRPSCAKVKIEVDMLATLPQRVRITEEDDVTGGTKFKWIKVQFDHMPKYCKECYLQGHDEQSCWTLHPELYETKEEEKEEGARRNDIKEGEHTKQDFKNKKGDSKQNRHAWKARSKNKYKRDKYGHIEGENDIQDDSPFEALNKDEQLNEQNNEASTESLSTKEWVNKNFSSKQEDEKQSSSEEQLGQPSEKTEEEENKEKQEDISVQNHQNLEKEEEKKEEEANANLERALVVVDVHDNEIYPLAVHNDNKEAFENKESDMNANTQIKLNPQALEFVPKSVNAKKNELKTLSSESSPTNVYDSDMDNDSFDEDEDEDEDEELDACFDKVARDGDISSKHQRNGSHKKKTHDRQCSWDGRLTRDFVPRHLPMRLAKQNHMIVSIDSTRSNKLKKK